MSETNRSVQQLVDEIGFDRVQEVCGVGPKSVQKAINDDEMPARWVGPLKEVEERTGINVPLNLFRFHRRPGGGRPRVRPSLDTKA